MFVCSKINAIYATAYLDGHLKLPDEGELKKKVAYTVAYMKLRCPTYGLRGNFWNFDLFPHVDGVLGEVGLGSYKRQGWRDSWTRPFLIEDLGGVGG